MPVCGSSINAGCHLHPNEMWRPAGKLHFMKTPAHSLLLEMAEHRFDFVSTHYVSRIPPNLLTRPEQNGVLVVRQQHYNLLFAGYCN